MLAESGVFACPQGIRGATGERGLPGDPGRGALTDVVVHIIQYIKSMNPVNLLLAGHLFFIVACMTAMSIFALNVLSAYFIHLFAMKYIASYRRLWSHYYATMLVMSGASSHFPKIAAMIEVEREKFSDGVVWDAIIGYKYTFPAEKAPSEHEQDHIE